MNSPSYGLVHTGGAIDVQGSTFPDPEGCKCQTKKHIHFTEILGRAKTPSKTTLADV